MFKRYAEPLQVRFAKTQRVRQGKVRVLRDMIAGSKLLANVRRNKEPAAELI